MADASNLTVAIEQAIHSGMRDSIQRIADEYGIFIDSIAVQWIDTSHQDKKSAQICAFTETSHS